MHQLTLLSPSFHFHLLWIPAVAVLSSFVSDKSKTIRKHAESGFIIGQFDSNNGPQPGSGWEFPGNASLLLTWNLLQSPWTFVAEARYPKSDPDRIVGECFKIISEHIYLIAQFSMIVPPSQTNGQTFAAYLILNPPPNDQGEIKG